MAENKKLEDWFEVSWDDEFIYRKVSPPGMAPWRDQFRWRDLIRICFEATDYLFSDDIYFFTAERPESYVVPIEAKGASALWRTIIAKGFSDAKLAIEAATTGSGIYCWPRSFKVFVDDNFHYQDKSDRYELGEFDSFEAAVAACQMIIDQYLMAAFKEGMDPAELYEKYISFGEEPFVIPMPEGASFSAWVYAEQRCSQICEAI
ncbi:MAG: hypothetical protein M5U34_15850 [Chloroflexi bacterium]|nr:hypothetical protein [Chloroflexota bacterium]